MTLVDEIREAWGWAGVDPVEVVGENDFGNLIIESKSGEYWRLCPEDCYCKVIATNRPELDRLSSSQEFLADWYMHALVELAQKKCGPLPNGRKYCLKIPSLFGGSYKEENLATVPLVELVRLSGHLAQQAEGLPDGTPIKFKVVE